MGSSRTLAAPSTFELPPVKGSRFLASLAPVASEDEASAFLAELRARMPDATHHCWAWKLASGRTRCSDDGEPGGSAGRPILARIEGKELEDVVVVVSRWYGGTKLGVGGLIRAYGGCAGKAIDAAQILERPRTRTLVLSFDYSDTAAIQAVLSAEGLAPAATEYGARVAQTLAVPEDHAPRIAAALVDATAGRALARWPDPESP
jgi:uncharacterized YigZ family protein